MTDSNIFLISIFDFSWIASNFEEKESSSHRLKLITSMLEKTRMGGGWGTLCSAHLRGCSSPPPIPADRPGAAAASVLYAREPSARGERERERYKKERDRERERERNRESGGVRGGDAGGYRRDDKGRKDGGRDVHGRYRDCYGDSRGSEKFRVPQQNIDINKQIMRAQGESELCTLIEARVAEFNYVVTAPHICLSYEHTNMTF